VQVRLSQLSTFAHPPKDGFMGILKGYFDDSKRDGVWALGGFVGSFANWGIISNCIGLAS
jgi:hypothetical protein